MAPRQLAKSPLRLLAVARNPVAAKRWLRHYADYWSFRRKYGSFLAEGAHLASSGRKALLVSLNSVPFVVKQEAMLAKALQMRGLQPVVATLRGSGAVRYFRLFGLDSFVFFDELIQGETAAPPDELARAFLDESADFARLKAIEYQGARIGRHILSSITRKLHRGRIDLRDPQVRDVFDYALPYSIRSVHAAEALLYTVRPEVVVFNERGYTPFGELFDTAVNHGINTIQFFGAHRADAYMLKRYTLQTRDLHGQSVSEETWNALREIPWTDEREAELRKELESHYEAGTWFNHERLQYGKKLKSKEEVSRQLGLDPSKKTAVVFSHLLWDASFFYGEDLFDTYEDWLVETARQACSNPAVNWLIKLHPANVWKLRRDGFKGELAERTVLRERLGTLPEHVKVLGPDTDINTFSLFAVTDYCLTVRGTIGIEMPCYGIPVFTAGTGRYSGLGFTIDSGSKEDYLAKIRHIQHFPKLSQGETELAKKHAYGLFILRPLDLKTLQMDFTDGDLDPRISLRARSFHDLVEATDLRSFADWAIGSRELDFLRLPLKAQPALLIENLKAQRIGAE